MNKKMKVSQMMIKKKKIIKNRPKKNKIPN